MQCNEIRIFKHFFFAHAAVYGGSCTNNDIHAECLADLRHFSSYAAIADNTQRLAVKLMQRIESICKICAILPISSRNGLSVQRKFVCKFEYKSKRKLCNRIGAVIRHIANGYSKLSCRIDIDNVISRCQNSDKFEFFARRKRCSVKHDFVDNQNIGVFCARQNLIGIRDVVISHFTELIEEIEIQFPSLCRSSVKYNNFHSDNFCCKTLRFILQRVCAFCH